MKLRTMVSTSLALLAFLCFVTKLFAIGSGGLLNLIPQAQVFLQDLHGAKQPVAYKVYVHPMEGSMALVRDGSDVILALDKNKHQAVEIASNAVTYSPDGGIMDVPEHTPYKVLAHAPHFGRTLASLDLGDGNTLVVTVKR